MDAVDYMYDGQWVWYIMVCVCVCVYIRSIA